MLAAIPIDTIVFIALVLIASFSAGSQNRRTRQNAAATRTPGPLPREKTFLRATKPMRIASAVSSKHWGNLLPLRLRPLWKNA